MGPMIKNGLSDENKGSENINYALVYGETFYNRHTALTPAVLKIRDDPWEQNLSSGKN